MYYDDSCQLTDDLGSVDFKTNGLTQLKPPFKVVENTGFHPKFTSWKLNFQFSSSLWRETTEEVPFLSFFSGKKSCSGSMLHLTTCLGESLWIMAERLVVVSNHLWWFLDDSQLSLSGLTIKMVPSSFGSKLFTVKTLCVEVILASRIATQFFGTWDLAQKTRGTNQQPHLT